MVGTGKYSDPLSSHPLAANLSPFTPHPPASAHATFYVTSISDSPPRVFYTLHSMFVNPITVVADIWVVHSEATVKRSYFMTLLVNYCVVDVFSLYTECHKKECLVISFAILHTI